MSFEFLVFEILFSRAGKVEVEAAAASGGGEQGKGSSSLIEGEREREREPFFVKNVLLLAYPFHTIPPFLSFRPATRTLPCSSALAARGTKARAAMPSFCLNKGWKIVNADDASKTVSGVSLPAYALDELHKAGLVADPLVR